jgi:uncharacterized protein (DUF342 family)
LAEAIEIDVSEDGLLAVVKQITPETTVDEIMSGLKEAGVTHGISGEEIQNAITNSQRSNRPIGEIAVAKGSASKPPVPPRVQPPENEPPLPPLGPIANSLN